MIELYQAEWCPHSHRVRQRLTELDLDFMAHQVPVPAERTGMERATGRRSIPTLVLDDGGIVLAAMTRFSPCSTDASTRRLTPRAIARRRSRSGPSGCGWHPHERIVS